MKQSLGAEKKKVENWGNGGHLCKGSVRGLIGTTREVEGRCSQGIEMQRGPKTGIHRQEKPQEQAARKGKIGRGAEKNQAKASFS